MNNTKLQELIHNKDLTRAIKKTQKNYIELNPNPTSTISIANNYSHFGGNPYMLTGEQYPVDEDGNNLQLLIQLNFDGLDVDNATGLLQIFIDPFKSNWGMSSSNPNYQSNFRVKYYPLIRDQNLVTDFEFLKADQFRDGYCSFFAPGIDIMNFDFNPKKMNITPADYHFELLIPELNPIDKTHDYQDYQSKAIKYGHRLGGYPHFNDHDPRFNQLFSDYVLLLQIDSFKPFWSWGDNGTATFLIHPNDFVNNDFSKVLFYWDEK
jgi:uncharacterized protein YwqG